MSPSLLRCSLALAASAGLLALASAQSPTVTLNNGYLEGVQSSTMAGKPYFSFHNIPFAEPPVGDYRFRVRIQLL